VSQREHDCDAARATAPRYAAAAPVTCWSGRCCQCCSCVGEWAGGTAGAGPVQACVPCIVGAAGAAAPEQVRVWAVLRPQCREYRRLWGGAAVPAQDDVGAALLHLCWRQFLGHSSDLKVRPAVGCIPRAIPCTVRPSASLSHARLLLWRFGSAELCFDLNFCRRIFLHVNIQDLFMGLKLGSPCFLDFSVVTRAVSERTLLAFLGTWKGPLIPVC
jgi:hypothetical protein